MAKFTFEINTGHGPMRSTADIATAMRKVADLIEPWGKLWASGREVLDAEGNQIGVFRYESDAS